MVTRKDDTGTFTTELNTQQELSAHTVRIHLELDPPSGDGRKEGRCLSECSGESEDLALVWRLITGGLITLVVTLVIGLAVTQNQVKNTQEDTPPE